MSKHERFLYILLMTLCMVMMISGFAVIFCITAQAQPQDTYIDPKYVQYCEEIGKRYGVQPEFLESFIEAESSGKADASNGSCKGLMQVYESVHRDRMKKLGVSNLYDPYGNILVGTDIIVELFERYGDDTAKVVMMYNGSSDAKQRAENFNFTDYATKVLSRAVELERIHDK